MRNEDELRDALYAQRLAYGVRRGDYSLRVPANFPRPQLAMPDQAFHPDFFNLQAGPFCSRRLRDALAQPPEVVEFIPVELVAGSAGARAKEYALMRVLAWDDVMDMEHSDYTPSEGIDPVTGVTRP